MTTEIGLGLDASDEPESDRDRSSGLSATFLWNSSFSLKVSLSTGFSATGGAKKANTNRRFQMTTLHTTNQAFHL